MLWTDARKFFEPVEGYAENPDLRWINKVWSVVEGYQKTIHYSPVDCHQKEENHHSTGPWIHIKKFLQAEEAESPLKNRQSEGGDYPMKAGKK